jgi:YidC/Oxa1 family membrane protein insertase
VIVNLQCSASQAGTKAIVKDTNKQDVRNGLPLLEDGLPIDALTSKSIINCGDGPVAKIPYILLLGLMVGTTFFQQRQMQKSSPPGSASQQQQAIMKVMPLFFGFIGFTFPAGLVLYWTTSNFFQIGQQTILLRAGHIGPEALDRRMAEQREKQANKPAEGKKGFMAGLLDRAEAERKDRGDRPTKGGSSSGGSSRGGSPKGGSSKGGSSPRGGTSGKGGSGRSNRSGSGSKGGKPTQGKRPRKPGSGGSDGQG